MAEYIDREDLLKRLPDDLPYKASVKRVLLQAPTLDVVPREGVDRLRRILNSYAIQYGTVKDQKEVIDRIKQETAREIFEEISAIIQRNTEHALKNGFLYVSGYNGKQIARLIYEFKEKYTED